MCIRAPVRQHGHLRQNFECTIGLNPPFAAVTHYQTSLYLTAEHPQHLIATVMKRRMNRNRELPQELESALEELARRRNEQYAFYIRRIVLTNWANGRVQSFLDSETVSGFDAYVEHVAEGYDEWHEYVYRMQVVRDHELWQALYNQLKRWAYGLARSSLTIAPRAEQRLHAGNCASDAGLELVNSHFPYDTAFEPWAYVVLRNVCRGHLNRLFNPKSIPDHEVINLQKWEGWLQNLSDPASQTPFEQFELGQLLAQAIDQLPPGQQEFVLLYYSEQRNYEEISELTGRSLAALYKARFDALKNLRKILGEMLNIYE